MLSLRTLERGRPKANETIKVGDTLKVFGWRARDGTPFAHLREVTLASGQRLFFGPPAGTGEGAPLPADSAAPRP